MLQLIYDRLYILHELQNIDLHMMNLNGKFKMIIWPYLPEIRISLITSITLAHKCLWKIPFGKWFFSNFDHVTIFAK